MRGSFGLDRPRNHDDAVGNSALASPRIWAPIHRAWRLLWRFLPAGRGTASFPVSGRLPGVGIPLIRGGGCVRIPSHLISSRAAGARRAGDEGRWWPGGRRVRGTGGRRLWTPSFWGPPVAAAQNGREAGHPASARGSLEHPAERLLVSPVPRRRQKGWQPTQQLALLQPA